MPRRTATPATPAPSAPLPPPPRDLVALADSDPEWAHNLRILRRHWKWANFSQFFYTFAPLLNMPDLFLSDLEDDLARGTNVYIPRIMHRLLYTLSQDRKLNIDNWQTALRRQYLRRDPLANPIGPEPKAPSRESSVDPSEKDEEDPEEVAKEEDRSEEESKPAQEAMNVDSEEKPTLDVAAQGEPSSNPKQEPSEDVKIPEEIPAESDDQLREVEEEESKDWLELPMLDKLDSLHLLTEWQFQNPYRVRQLMKDDDDAANWRIEPIGYDAKTNAYWLIGPDRLWIQRAPPKPPRNRTLKRKRPAAPPKKAARAKVEESSSDEEEEEVPARSKRTRPQSQSKSRSQNQANGRATRTSRRAAQSSNDSSDLILPGKSSRAAKVQANKKLDVQAKELAEYQRQAARLASAKSRANASPRKSRGASSSPAKRAVGTRVSARLRNSIKDDGEDDEDEEWQQVPEEWLQDPPSPTRRSTRTRNKGKQREEPEEEELEEDEERVAEEQANEEEGGEYDGEEGKEDEDGEVNGDGAGEEADGDVGKDDLLQKAGLESGSVSDLTDLSDQEQSDEDAPPATTPRQRARNGGRRKPSRSTRGTRRTKAASADPSPSVSNSKSKSKAKRNARSEPEPEEEDQEMEEPELEPEPPAPAVPEDFVEWETIAVTLTEWEHIAEPFAKATHYLERALYKMLTQNIVPIVVEDLREAEKRKRLEAAIVHRKRSSRIAIKESEKEEARLAAKKKAEDEEKLARARRQEVRQKKEDAERAKRERAREQRAKEREEREARARAKAERAERFVPAMDEAAAARSTGTPSVNGTQQSSSIQPSRVVTPNGVHTPDWMLDCEVCHKHGVNLDDGKAMVSCSSCNRWQHIACHNLHDQRSGRPCRDWETQQFYCSRCRQRSLNGGLYGGQGYSAHRQQQYAWAQSGQPIHLQKPGGMDPFAHTSDMRYSHRSPVENGAGYSQQQYLSNNVGAAPYPRSSYPNTGFSFNHYQPDQRGLQSRAIPSTPQGSWSSNGGYGALPDPLAARSPSSPFASQYAHNGSMYASSRMSSGYQNHGPPPHTAQYNDHTSGMSSSRWPSSTSNGYHSPAVQEAAHSLAFMQDGSSSRYSSSSAWPAASSYGQHATASSQSHHSSYSHAPAPTGIDPLTGQSFSTRVEQHVGHGPPHTNGATSFNYPSS
ncbi:hypothetical protein C8Q74DRAFT_1349421 [Fomes fomentarius]|nr:hypothetical protein C8Q74DRAFT_1349421 [Fomes fomentarius]